MERLTKILFMVCVLLSVTVVTQAQRTLPSTTTLVKDKKNTVYGESVTFTATVHGNTKSIAPTGTVQFTCGNERLGKAVTLKQGTDGSVASLTISSLDVNTGGHVIGAIYSGDNISSSSSANINHVVQKANTAVTITNLAVSSNQQSLKGEVVLEVLKPGNGSPQGQIELYVNGTTNSVGYINVTSVGTHSFTVNLPTMIAGTHSLAAKYLGDNSFNASDLSRKAFTLSEIVEKPSVPTYTYLTSNSVVNQGSTSVYGESVTFTARVEGESKVNEPSGTVQFECDGVKTGSPVSLSHIQPNNNIATWTTSSLEVNTGGDSHTIGASYSGDKTFLPSGANLPHRVNPASTSVVMTGLTLADNKQTLTGTAQVSVVAPGSGTPTGLVDFYLDGSSAPFGSGTLNASGTASFSITRSFNEGSHTVKASYRGDNRRYNGSQMSPDAYFTVYGKMNVSTSISSSSKTTVYGENVTFTATVISEFAGQQPNIRPTGTVQFFYFDPVLSNKINVGGAVALTQQTSSSSVANLTVSSLDLGQYSICVEYNGDSNFNPGWSDNITVEHTVILANTTAVMTNLTLASDKKTLTGAARVSVTAPGSGTPTGTVHFYMDGETAPFSSGTLNASGTAGFTVTKTFTLGNHAVTASYAGSRQFNASKMSPAFYFSLIEEGKAGFSDLSTIYKYYGDPAFPLPPVTGGQGENPTYRYRSDNPAVASVDVNTGMVTVVSEGEAYMFFKQLTIPESDEGVPIKVVVSQKPVTVTGVTATKQYDGNNVFTNAQINIAGAVINGIVGSDVVALSKTGVTGVFGPNVGTGNLTLSGSFTLTGADAGHYILSSQPVVKATIVAQGSKIPTAIVVTARSGSSYYGDSPANPGISATGLVDGDTESVLTGLGNSFGITATTPAGAYTLTVTGALTNPDYTVSSFVSGVWTVNKRPITITAVDKIINSGETFELEYEITSGKLVNGDVLTGSIYCDPPYTMGEHAITQGTLSAGDNYAITFVPGTLTVRSDDASVRLIEVDGVSAERNGNNFNIFSPCGANNVEVRVTANTYATVITNNVQQNPLRVNLPDYGDNTFTIRVTSQTGNTQTYTLTVYRSVPVDVAFFDRFSDVLTVPAYVEGIGAVNSVEWFHNGNPIPRDPVKGYVEMIEAGAYYALLNGRFRTCEIIKTRSTTPAMSVYPNPVAANQEITVCIENPAGEDARLQILSMDGRLLKTLTVDGNQHKIKVTAPAYSGLVALKLISSTTHQEIKLIVK